MKIILILYTKLKNLNTINNEIIYNYYCILINKLKLKLIYLILNIYVTTV
jgi:hypothetical protein